MRLRTLLLLVALASGLTLPACSSERQDDDATVPGDDDASPSGDDDASPAGDDDASPAGDDDASPSGDDDASPSGDDDASPSGDDDASQPGDDDASAGIDADQDGVTQQGDATHPGDCDDTDPQIYPGAAERCNNEDDNCNGQIDDGVPFSSYHLDADSDGYGDPAVTTQACAAGNGFVVDGTDCDDAAAAVHPGAEEVCNQIDDDCDGQTDEGGGLFFFADTDGDGFGDPETVVEACALRDGLVENDGDCDDDDAEVNPEAVDLFVDGVDADCDGIQDLASRLAGLGVYNGDGLPATGSSLSPLGGMAIDLEGDLYIADNVNCMIRRVDKNGIMTRVAGSGRAGFAGDGGPATDASLLYPQGIAFDAEGRLLIADTANNRIRRVSSTGIISTIAGTGDGAFSGDGGPATAAGLHPFSIFWTLQGELLLTDSSNYRVRKIDADGIISTVAGNGVKGFSGDGGPATSASFNTPRWVVADSKGALYISDIYNNRIRRVDSAGTVTTLAGNGSGTYNGDNGPATQASFYQPEGLLLDGFGQLFIADQGNNRVRRIDDKGTITTVAGNGMGAFGGDGGPAILAQLYFPCSLTLDASGILLIGDSGNRRVRKVAVNGTISTLAGSGTSGYNGDGIPASQALLNTPYDAVFDAGGNLFIADTSNNRVRRVDPNGVISTVAGTGVSGLAGDGGPGTKAQLNAPRGLALDLSGNLYISDTYARRIRKLDTQGILTTVAGNGSSTAVDNGPATQSGLNSPRGLAVDGSSNLFIVEQFGYRIRRVDTTGTITTFAGTGVSGYSGDGGSASQAQLNQPTDVVISPEGVMYIADAGGNRIRRVEKGVISTVAGNGVPGNSGDGGPATSGELQSPLGLEIDSRGYLYIADLLNGRIRMVDTAGVLTTIAGDVSNPILDSGPAADMLLAPFAVAIAPDETLIVVDSSNQRIMQIEP